MEARCIWSMLLGEYIYGGHWPLDFDCIWSMLLGEYIYGGHWPLDFEVLRAMIIHRLNYALQRFIIALILTFFFVKINK